MANSITVKGDEPVAAPSNEGTGDPMLNTPEFRSAAESLLSSCFLYLKNKNGKEPTRKQLVAAAHQALENVQL